MTSRIGVFSLELLFLLSLLLLLLLLQPLQTFASLLPQLRSRAVPDYPKIDITANTKIHYPAHIELNAIEKAVEMKHYPPLHSSLLDVVERWNPDVQEPPEVFEEELMHFNFSDPDQLAIAEKLRDLEVPFKVYGFKGLESVINKWNDEYLIRAINRQDVEVSKSNHFMYWSDKGSRNPKGYVSPTSRDAMTFSTWLDKAYRADQDKLENDKTHYYFHLSTRTRTDKLFINADLPFLTTKTPNFWISKPSANKGIQCRLGMRGIIAESHFDHGRNMIMMLRGNKRYIINPPEACKYLGVIADRNHPSYRHSVFDWSDIEQARAHGLNKARAIDTIVREGEILYIPSYWLHYVISLQMSIQCNSRSGSPDSEKGQEHANECVDRVKVSEKSGRKGKKRNNMKEDQKLQHIT